MHTEKQHGLSESELTARVDRFMNAAHALALGRVNQLIQEDLTHGKFLAELAEVEKLAEPYLEPDRRFEEGMSHGVQQANLLHQKATHSNFLCFGIVGFSATGIANLFPAYQSQGPEMAIWEPFLLIYLMCGLLALWGVVGLFLSRKS